MHVAMYLTITRWKISVGISDTEVSALDHCHLVQEWKLSHSQALVRK